MKDIFYFGARLRDSLSHHFANTGHTLLHLSHTQGLHELQDDTSPCEAVLLEWRTRRDQRVIAEAKSRGIPVIVLTTRISESLRTSMPTADLYLEEPAPDEEIVEFTLELIATRNLPRLVQPAAKVQACSAIG
jgi:hypothetical protein